MRRVLDMSTLREWTSSDPYVFEAGPRRGAAAREQFARWVADNGGITVWESQLLEEGGRQWLTPLNQSPSDPPAWRLEAIGYITSIDAMRIDEVQLPVLPLPKQPVDYRDLSAAQTQELHLRQFTDQLDVRCLCTLHLPGGVYSAVEYRDHRSDKVCYVVMGVRSKALQRRCYLRFEGHSATFYMAGYIEDVKPQHAAYNPAGPNFTISSWPHDGEPDDHDATRAKRYACRIDYV